MNAPSAVSIRLIPAAKISGSEITARNGTWCVATPAARAQQPDLGRRVEAEPEQDAERVHLPARVDPAADPLEQEAREEPLVEQRALEVLLVVVPALHPPEDADDVEQHHEVERSDQQEEHARDGGADGRAVGLQGRDRRVHRLEGHRERGREREDDRRVAEREEEAGAERPLPVLQQLPRRVVDRRDVVGVEGVPQPEGVGERGEAGQRRVARQVVEEEPEAEHVQEQDAGREAAEPRPLRTRHARSPLHDQPPLVAR